MKKRVLVLLTTFCLSFTSVAGPVKVSAAETTTNETTSTTVATGSAIAATGSAIATTAKVGDEVSGFRITQTAYDSATKSTKILFSHIKTGAKLLVIKNNDLNRGFSIKFNTPAENDKGINHIIEHSVLGGSVKYPSNNIIFDLGNTTYSSFVNALTYENMTVYPVCSLSEEQLLKSTDIYLASVFQPLLLSDKRIFEREGMRYELASAKSKLSYNGIVYNEMQGSMGNIDSASLSYATKAIFPESNQGNISGGDPNAITTLTYKEVIDTYKKNYHPSNSFMVLYGDVKYEEFLKMIDENYLSSYSKKVYSIDRENQKPFRKLVQKTYDFPVAKGTDTTNKSVIDLVFALSDIKELGIENFVELNMAISLLNLDSSELKKELLDSKIAENYSIMLDPTTYQPTLHFIAKNADPSKKDAFYKLVKKQLNQIVSTGLDTEIIKSSLRSLEFAEKLGSNGNGAANTIIQVSLYDNLLGDSLIDYNDYYKKIVDKLDQKVLEKIIKEQILENNFAALTVTTPKAGLLEANQKAVAKTLAKKQSTMTQKQIKALVKKTKDFNQWNSQATSDKILKSLRAVSLKDISTEVKDREIKESTVDGVKLLSTNADVDSISSMYYTFDLSHLTSEELLYLKFYGDMIGSGMATEKRSESQVMNESTYKANGIMTSTTMLTDDKNDSAAHPIFAVKYYGFEDEYADTFDLVSDILLQSKVSDISTYGTRTIANIKANFQNQIADPLMLSYYRAQAYTSPTYRLYDYLYGLEYYQFALTLEKKIASNPSEVVEKLKAIRTKAFNKNNLTILFAGEKSALEAYQSSMTLLTKKLPDVTYAKAVYTLPVHAKREALTINSPVQYVFVNSSLLENKVPISGKASVITNILNNLLLTPEIRLKGGAYGVGAVTSQNNYATYTYRDSSYVNSLAIIGGTDEFLKSITPYMTEDTLESYKLSAYAAASQNTNDIDDAMSTLLNKIQGFTIQDRISFLNEIKDTTISDITAYAGYLEKLNSNQNYIVVASPSEIEAHKDLFDEIIPLQ